MNSHCHVDEIIFVIAQKTFSRIILAARYRTWSKNFSSSKNMPMAGSILIWDPQFTVSPETVCALTVIQTFNARKLV
jgi:hypothetical protein